MSTDGFEWVWQSTLRVIEEAGSPPDPSAEVKAHLQQMYAEACKRPASEQTLQEALVRTIRYLVSDEGRTPDNCRVVSNFIMPGDELWEEDWDELPERFVEVFGILGHELLQSVDDPEWAETYGGSPKQILQELLTSTTAVEPSD